MNEVTLLPGEVLMEEVTDWSPMDTPNHVYVLNDKGQLAAYFQYKSMNNFFRFKKPYKCFSKSNRKFIKLKDTSTLKPKHNPEDK